MTDTAEVSVIIPFFENQHGLDLVLAGLSVQTHPLCRLQVVVADDGSALPPSVPEYARGLDITIVRQPDKGFRAGTARNLGVAKSDGSVLVFLDGDTVPMPRYVEELSALPSVLPDAVVSGRRRYADLTGWTAPDLLAWFAGRRDEPAQWDEPAWMTDEYARTGNLLHSHPRSYKYLIGAVLGCTREMFDELDGFDETITGYGGEDYDFTYRAYNARSVFAYVPQAVAWHDGPDWSARTDPDHQLAQKNRETLMLAERIPEPSMRGAGQIYPTVDVIVVVDSSRWSLGAGVLCVRSMLATLDCGVWIDDQGDGSNALGAAFGSDPRVRARPLDPVTDKIVIDRARLQLRVCVPFLAGPALTGEIGQLFEDDAGTVTIAANGRAIATGESSRSLRRKRRSAPSSAHIPVRFFPHVELDHIRCGVSVLDAEPRLAAVFGGYA